jgi:hypothetical protein
VCWLQTLDAQMAGEQGSKLDVYEMEVANERGDALQDLAEFNLAVVSGRLGLCIGVKGWTRNLKGQRSKCSTQ